MPAVFTSSPSLQNPRLLLSLSVLLLPSLKIQDRLLLYASLPKHNTYGTFQTFRGICLARCRTPVVSRNNRTGTPVPRSTGGVVSEQSPIIHDSNFSESFGSSQMVHIVAMACGLSCMHRR